LADVYFSKFCVVCTFRIFVKLKAENRLKFQQYSTPLHCQAALSQKARPLASNSWFPNSSYLVLSITASGNCCRSARYWWSEIDSWHWRPADGHWSSNWSLV